MYVGARFRESVWSAGAVVVAAVAITLIVAGCSGAEVWDGSADPEQSAPSAPEPSETARLNGIDVSEFQGEIDWQAVKASGVVFAFARALEGETIIDSRFADSWEDMKEAGIVRGAYDFYVADDSVESQVENFTALVTLEPGDLVPMVDIETASLGGQPATADLVSDFHQYLDLMEAHYGVKPIIYTDPDFWNENLDDSFGDYALWVAVYDVDSPTLPDGWSD
jgi:lysozyme